MAISDYQWGDLARRPEPHNRVDAVADRIRRRDAVAARSAFDEAIDLLAPPRRKRKPQGPTGANQGDPTKLSQEDLDGLDAALVRMRRNEMLRGIEGPDTAGLNDFNINESPDLTQLGL